ncbi:hypothetical protein Q7I37_07125 [Aeromonas allosaccharophila]
MLSLTVGVWLTTFVLFGHWAHSIGGNIRSMSITMVCIKVRFLHQ